MIDSVLKYNLDNIALKIFELTNFKGDKAKAINELHVITGMYMLFDLLEQLDLPKRKEYINKLNVSEEKLTIMKEIMAEFKTEILQKTYKLAFRRAVEDHVDGDYVKTIGKERSESVDMLLKELI